MNCQSGRGMATLLQQKNCMKNLTNGGARGGGTNNSNITAQAAGTNNNTTTQQQIRALLPHEMVGVPPVVSAQSGGPPYQNNSVVVTSSGSFGTTISNVHHQQQHHQPNSQQQQQQQQNQPNQQQQQQIQNFSHNQFNSNQLNHLNQFSNYSQLNNETTIIYLQTTSANNINSSNSTTSSHIIGTNTSTNLITTSSSPIGGILTTSSLPISQQQTHHIPTTTHYQNLGSVLHDNSLSKHNTPSTTNSLQLYHNSSHSHQQQRQQTQQQPNHHHQQQQQQQQQRNNNLTNQSPSTNNNLQQNSTPPNSSTDGSSNQHQSDNIHDRIGNQQDEMLPNGGQPIDDDDQEPEPEIDIVINNVVCSFSVKCHLNLREIALNGFNVEFRRENGMVTMKLRRPYTTASIWSSGRITCTGATSEIQAKIAARRYARCLQKLGFSVKFNNFRVVNVLGTCSMPWAIKIVNFSEKYKKDASYEPELHPGVTYKLKYPKATLKIFSTGSITVTAGSVAYVQAAIEHIFPLVYEFRKKRTAEDLELLRSKQQPLPEEPTFEEEQIHSPSAKRKRPLGLVDNDQRDDTMYISDYGDHEADVDAI